MCMYVCMCDCIRAMLLQFYVHIDFYVLWVDLSIFDAIDIDGCWCSSLPPLADYNNCRMIETATGDRRPTSSDRLSVVDGRIQTHCLRAFSFSLPSPRPLVLFAIVTYRCATSNSSEWREVKML